METLGEFERPISWELVDRAGSSRTVALRTGMTLSIVLILEHDGLSTRS